ncbi:MAG: cation:proton antiporter [Chromatiaceae bacterium]
MSLSESILVIALLLTLGMISAGLLRKLPLPYTVLLVVIGLGLGRLADGWAPAQALRGFRLTPDVVLFIFLPTLIFESGLSLNARQLIKDVAPVMILAVFALLLSTVLVGLGVWLGLRIPLATALLFGALISATDPVAVVALFRELGVPQRLLVLVEGESLLNDATAVVVFKILLGLALFGGLSVAEAGRAATEFLEVFFGGALVGVAFGLAASWLMLRLHAGTAEVLGLSAATAYAGFIVADHQLGFSGVMAVGAAALTLGVLGIPRLAAETAHALREVWEFLAHVSNTLLFIMIGLTVDLGSLVDRLDALLWAVLLVLIARAATIYSLVPAATRLFHLPNVGLAERHVMWWGGLKGGLAIAMVLSIPPDMDGRQLLVDLTVGVVLFSLLVNATTIRPLIRRLGIDRLSPGECADLETGMRLVRTQSGEALRDFTHWNLLSAPGRRRVEESLERSLHAETCQLEREDRLRRARLDALGVELKTLERLLREHVVPQYIYFDLKGELQRERDHVEAGQAPQGPNRSRRRANPFLRLEDGVLHLLRERDWAARLVARYQNLRGSEHLLRDIARLLMAEAALNHLREQRALATTDRERLASLYQEQVARSQRAVEEVRRSYPAFYKGFEARLALQAALSRARQAADEARLRGTIGAKPHTIIRRQIDKAQEHVPSLTRPVPEAEIGRRIAELPLLRGLSASSLARIAERAAVVGYLLGDTIIGQDERGDALYVLVRGRATVSRRGQGAAETVVAHLEPGDFFGEIALLEDQVRTATVRASQPCILVRITRGDMLELAASYRDIAARLEAMRQLHRGRDTAEGPA